MMRDKIVKEKDVVLCGRSAAAVERASAYIAFPTRTQSVALAFQPGDFLLQCEVLNFQ